MTAVSANVWLCGACSVAPLPLRLPQCPHPSTHPRLDQLVVGRNGERLRWRTDQPVQDVDRGLQPHDVAWLRLLLFCDLNDGPGRRLKVAHEQQHGSAPGPSVVLLE